MPPNCLSTWSTRTALGFILLLVFTALWYSYDFLTSTVRYPVLRLKDIPLCNLTQTTLTKEVIPNLVHFVYILKDNSSELRFHFSDFLSVYAVWHYWHPDIIYLHTDAPEETINRARNGRYGKWSKLMFDLPNLQTVHVSNPTRAGNGVDINLMEHKSDFVRVQAIRNFGGTYIDFDAHPLRDIKVLRQSGFSAISGRQLGGQVNSGTFMSVKGGKMISLWAEQMHQVYTGGWTTHSNEVITRIGEQLVAQPGEMLIMEREAFAPGSWESHDAIQLFQVHNDTVSNLENIAPGAHLPSFDDDSIITGTSKNAPSWATNWSRTYILHAFKPERSGASVDGFNGITPRYVLERQSNFARAVYPIAKILYDRGLVEAQDL